ncbi:hypothetical protein E3N88_18791 [Mikania micrantha]|uniref:Uncharacterized protein n=1 Tax=Mikania micrantha TaxID=192012 RepID=A0A5N6NNU0_9ASTR|nr:hypothetical protein E3N88_18791 [Mikania micrantha]
MPPRRQPALLPPPPHDSAPHSSTPTPPDSPTQPPPPHPPPPRVHELDPATIALATLLTSQLRDVIPEMMNRINSNNSNNIANSSGEELNRFPLELRSKMAKIEDSNIGEDLVPSNFDIIEHVNLGRVEFQAPSNLSVSRADPATHQLHQF